jgi:serine protease AprX
LSVGTPREGIQAVVPSQRRFLVQFESEEAVRAAQAIEVSGLDIAVANPRRKYLSVTSTSDRDNEPRHEAERELDIYAREFHARIIQEHQYALDAVPDDPLLPDEPDEPERSSLDDVLALIRAREAWHRGRGADVTVAVVDTGVNGERAEFHRRQKGGWAEPDEDPWTDYHGHGTMCASIAVGSKQHGGLWDGVAPEANLISCRTHFYEGELAAIYDYLGDLALEGNQRVIATNSFGERTGTAPAESESGVFEEALGDAISAGVIVVFSAGNNHRLAGGKANECKPTSIWLHKCREDVMTVAGCQLDLQPWFYSSRGPGQFANRPRMAPKPDVTAPTPAYAHPIPQLRQ